MHRCLRFVVVSCLAGASACRAITIGAIPDDTDAGTRTDASAPPIEPADGGRDETDGSVDPSPLLDGGTPTSARRRVTYDVTTREDEALRVTFDASSAVAPSLRIVDEPSRGEATLRGATLTYAPDRDFYGRDELTLAAADADIIVALHVTAVNDGPTSSRVVVRGEQGSALVVDVSPWATDADGDPLVFRVDPRRVPVFARSYDLSEAGQLEYVHDGSEGLEDVMGAVACDPSGECTSFDVAILLGGRDDLPSAGNARFGVAEGGSFVGALGPFASDPEGARLAFFVDQSPRAASDFVLYEDGLFGYQHDGSEGTADSFVYRACERAAPERCATARVDIDVEPVADVPVAVDHAVSVDEGSSVSFDLRGVVVDPEGTPLVFEVTSPAASAAKLVVDPSGAVSYEHDGSESPTDGFDYRVCRAGSTLACSSASVFFLILPVNDAPSARDLRATIDEGETLDVDLRESVTDPEGGVLSYRVVGSPPVHASSFALGSTGALHYVHDGGEQPVTDSFTYEVCDDAAPSRCSTATVYVTVLATDDPPVAVQRRIDVDEGGSVSAELADFAFDPEGAAIEFLLVAGPSGNHAASLDVSRDGLLEYVHDGSESRSDFVVYDVCEVVGQARCVRSVVTVVVTAINDSPVAVDLEFSVGSGQLLQNAIWPYVFDPEDDLIRFTRLGDPPPGAASFVLNVDGSFFYRHDGVFVGPDTFSYEACDDGDPTACDVGVVTIQVE